MDEDINVYLHHLVQLAVYVCRTPTALIHISERHKSQYSVSFGWNANWHEELPFYIYTPTDLSLFIVEDTLSDPRFAEYLSRQAEPQIRFYAGTPLVTSHGSIIGMLCVLDYIPRTLNSEQSQVLTLLARQAIFQLEAHSLLDQTTSTLAIIKEEANTLQQKHKLLQQQIKELEQQNLGNQLLNQLGTSLQTCITFEEAYTAIAPLLPQIFPDYSGRIFIMTISQQNIASSVVEWGNQALPKLKEINLEDCYALKFKGQNFSSDIDSPTKRCPHCRPRTQFPQEQKLFCFPLKNEEKVLGVVHLYSKTQQSLSPTKNQFVLNVIQQLTLSFKNLKLLNTLKLESIRDPLTGLFNRRYFNEILERLLARSSEGNYTVSLVMIDIDHFKSLNDTFGHPAGDKILQDFSIFLKGYVRPTDIACRYGGEEFVLILPECSLEIAVQRAEKVRRGIQYMVMRYQGKRLGKVTVSLGVASFPHQALTLEKLVEVADTALYQAKAQGRNQVCTAVDL